MTPDRSSLRGRTLRVRMTNVGRMFAGPAEMVIGVVAEIVSGRPVIDVSGVVQTLAEGLDRDVAYEIELGGENPEPKVERIIERLIEAGLHEVEPK